MFNERHVSSIEIKQWFAVAMRCEPLGYMRSFARRLSSLFQTQPSHSILIDFLFSHIFSHHFLLFDLSTLPVVLLQRGLEMDCQAAVPAYSKQTWRSLPLAPPSSSRLGVSPRWPAVGLAADVCSTLEGFHWQHASHTTHSGHTQTYAHTLLWFCRARLSYSSQAGVPPSYSRCWPERI